MDRIRFAIYLYGHGTRREPCMIEYQHRAILRAIPWMGELWGGHPEPGEVFIDMNFPPVFSQDAPPGLVRLAEQIRNGGYQHVALCIHGAPALSEPQFPVEHALKTLGAQVCNLAAQPGPYVQELAREPALSERLARALPPSPEEEFVTLFPTVAAQIAREALGLNGREGDITFTAEAARRMLDDLASRSPYRQGEIPWARWRDLDRVRGELERERELDQRRRKSTDPLWRLGPRRAGVLLDELSYAEQPRPADELAWAESRLCDELGFERIDDGRVRTFQRKIRDLLLFGDPRPQRHIGFYAYRPAQKKDRRRDDDGLDSPSFTLPDTYKHNLNAWLKRALKDLKNHRIGFYDPPAKRETDGEAAPD